MSRNLSKADEVIIWTNLQAHSLKCVFTNLRIRSDGDFWFGEAGFMYPWGPLRYHPDTQKHAQSTVLDEYLRFKKNLAKKKIAFGAVPDSVFLRICEKA